MTDFGRVRGEVGVVWETGKGKRREWKREIKGVGRGEKERKWREMKGGGGKGVGEASTRG